MVCPNRQPSSKVGKIMKINEKLLKSELLNNSFAKLFLIFWFLASLRECVAIASHLKVGFSRMNIFKVQKNTM